MKKPKPNNSPLIIIASIVILGSVALFLVLIFFTQKPAPVDDLEGSASQALVEQGNRERDQYPLLAHLPIQNAIYTVGYQFEEDGSLTIIVDTTEYYRDFVIKKLESLTSPDHPLSSYHIRFIDTYTTK